MTHDFAAAHLRIIDRFQQRESLIDVVLNLGARHPVFEDSCQDLYERQREIRTLVDDLDITSEPAVEQLHAKIAAATIAAQELTRRLEAKLAR